MGRLARALFVAIPVLLTLASALLQISILISQRSTTSLSSRLYFYRLDARNFTLPGYTAATTADWYHIGLFGYCKGDGAPTSTTASFCSKPTTFFHFDPIAAFGLAGSTFEKVMPTDWTTLLDAYTGAAKWMSIAFIAALATSVLTILLAFAALFSRLGSLACWLTTSLANTLLLAAAITATALHLAVVGAFRTQFGMYGLAADLGAQALAVVWVAVACNLAAAAFWALTACCCAAHRDRGAQARGHGYGKEKGFGARGRTPTWLEARRYERVPSPYRGAETLHDVHSRQGSVALAADPHGLLAGPGGSSTSLADTPQGAYTGAGYQGVQQHGPSLGGLAPPGEVAWGGRDDRADAYEPYRA